MSKRKFVREIKAKEIKNINPSDIIYLAMKDGSIILIADDDEETIEYNDLKLDMSNKRRRNYYNKNTNIKHDSSLYTFENENNSKRSSFTNNILDNNSNVSTIYSKINQVKDKNKVISKIEKPKNRENERNNKTINYKNLNYEIKNEKLDKSFDDIRANKIKNLGYHEIEYFNNPNKSFESKKIDLTLHERSKSNNKYIINNNYNNERRRRKNIINKFTTNDDNKRNSTDIIDISDISFESNDNHRLNKTPNRVQKRKLNDFFIKKEKNEYNNGNSNYRNRRNQLKSQRPIDINPKSGQNYFVKKKELEIMGRIINDRNSYKNIDHNHPNTLFDPKCIFCQNLARENNLSISNIKAESIYDNFSFMASFGGSGTKREKEHNENNRSGKYYL